MPTATTTYHGPPAPKPITKAFAWSYSRLKNWRSCPLKHYCNDLAKTVKPEKSEALDAGFAAHDAIAKFLQGRTSALPPLYRDYEPEVRRVVGHDPAGTTWLVEQNMAIRRDFTACDGFDPAVWLRAKTDFVKVLGPVAVAIDWKTGQIKEDQEQLGLMAQCVFSAYPAVQKIRTQYVWLGNHALTTLDFTRAEMAALWMGIMPEVEAYETACRTGDFPPRPSGLCKRHCNVTSCIYHGRGSY